MKLDDAVLAVIGSSHVMGRNLVLPAQLERKLYLAVAKALECAGGKWHKTAKCHVFDDDAEERVGQILATGQVTNAKQEFGFFETPLAIVDRLLKLARLQPHHDVLEPSAGHGAIARRILDTGGCALDVVELLPANAAVLRQVLPATSVVEYDFLEIHQEPLYDRIVMNPPFAKQADIRHVGHALGFLRPGGRLVAVMSAGVKFRDDTLTRAFRDRVDALGGTVADLPEGAFKVSGTGVNTVVVSVKLP